MRIPIIPGGLLRVAAAAAFATTFAAAFVGAASVAGAQQTPPVDTTAKSTPVNLVGLGPNGATLRCRDGSYPAPFAPETACEGKGGVLVRFRVRGSPPPRPVQVEIRAPQGPVPVEVEPPPLLAPVSRANVRIPTEEPPKGTTLTCRDGTFIVADTTSSRCAAHGGVRVRFLPERP